MSFNIIEEEQSHQRMGEPDVFETEDALESSSLVSNVEKIPEHLLDSIESTKIDVEDSRGKFATKNLDTSHQDYSESIVSFRRRRQQSQRDQSEYEMMGEEINSNVLRETNLQKFNRLQFEITQFINQITDSDNGKEGDDKSVHSNSSIAAELNLLRHQLDSLTQNDQMARIIDPKIDVKQSASLQQNLSNKLLQQISSLVLHSNANQDNNADPQKTSTNPSLTYELYLTPDHNKLKEISKAAGLEQRITQLEELVGGQQLNPSGLGKPIVEVVDQLKEKFESFSSPSNISELQKNMQMFNHQIEVAIEKKKAYASVAPAINEQKINELFDTISKWDVTAQQLPSIVQRLQSLRNLHEQSISFVNTVQQLEMQQQEMKQLLQSNNELASKLEGNFSSNMNVIQSNISSLEKRFDDLRKKLEHMGLETF